MRRTLAATVVALSLAASTLAAATPSSADDGFSITPESAPAVEADEPTPAQTLAQAQAALGGQLRGDRRPEATLALRDLFVSLPQLQGDDRAQAEGILARPTDGADDPYGDGYTVRAKKKCAKKVCLHWVSSTSDAAGEKWVNKSLRSMKRVWRKEVGTMDYRRPAKDGRRGGKGGKFDVYLKDVGAQGLYGYCAPEFTVRGKRRDASGYCVLDNDYARPQFGAKPVNSLKVTAAHEFFHAVQFAYDYKEDPWLMEATATWMEERFADAVNDNRQYLQDGQSYITYRPLDTFDRDSTVQYGNWVFFEYLGLRFGQGIVKRIWRQLDGGRGKTYSTNAIKRVLPRRASFKKVYAQFAAANTTPGRSYPEGNKWPTPVWVGKGRLGKGEVASGTVNISHMATNDFKLTPRKDLKKKKFKLRVRVNGPKRRTSPMAAVVWQKKSGKVKRMLVKLNRKGNGAKMVPFNRKQTRHIYVAAVNASTRFNCGAAKSFTYSCRGVPRDDGKAYTLRFKVVNGRR